MCWHHRGSNNVGKIGIIPMKQKLLQSSEIEIIPGNHWSNSASIGTPSHHAQVPNLDWSLSLDIFTVIWHCLKPILLPHLKLDDVLNLVAGQVQLDAVINLQAQDDDIQCRTDMAKLPDSNLWESVCEQLEESSFQSEIGSKFCHHLICVLAST